MKRLIVFWRKYRPALSNQSLHYLQQVCWTDRYPKGELIKLSYQQLPYFFILLEGLVGGYEHTAWVHGAQPELRELILPMDYFTGTIHPFTQRNRQVSYEAITSVVALKLSLQHARTGQQAHPDLGELFQVMKQRKIIQLRHQVAIFQKKDHYRRYCLYRELLPEWAIGMPHHIQQQFLQISPSHYKRIKAIYLSNNYK